MATTVLITGASSGIGAEFARQLASDGATLILVARRADRLEALAAELREAKGVRVEVLPADVAKPGAAAEIRDEVAKRGLTVDWLINNAGLGHHGPFLEADDEVDRKLIDLNITALTALTRAFLPGMASRKQGAVLNVASTAAFQSIPYFAVYAATKAYVLSFSEALAEEVAPRGVTVSCICPGPTESEFASHAAFKTDIVDRAPTMTAEDVVDDALAAWRGGRPVQVAGWLNTVTAMAPRLLPRQLVTKVSGSLFRPTR